MDWKDIAWNGIRFESPRDWELGMIGPRYLMLEYRFEPVLEIKWGRVKGRFSARTYLSRLTTHTEDQRELSARECSLPDGWKKSLDAFEATGFSWQGKSFAGKGVILYCPVCRHATLIQFYFKTPMKTESWQEHLLASFQDHRSDNQVEWKVFDIRASIPSEFKLRYHRFESGKYEMTFASDGQKITLYRYGPASILLKKEDLSRFTSRMAGVFRHDHWRIVQNDSKVVEWEAGQSATPWLSWFHLMKGTPPIRWIRFWHVEEKNRILGLKAEGREPFPQHFLKQICEGYESL